MLKLDARDRPWNRGWRRFVTDHIIAEVPDEIAACEFECHEAECSGEKWERCQRRLRAMESAKGIAN